ncbi:MAG: SulP family inorganic anion transporter [Gemmatimonadetes bacterium]|nr:SulP family inorganic anion transporter [Gemmatimonadota bacterium]
MISTTRILKGSGLGSIRSHNLLAGASVACLLIPQSMAYAELAGLPVQLGLYAAALAPIAASALGSSPYLQTGPVALTALLTLGAVVPLAASGSDEYIGLVALLALVVALVQAAIGFLRLGWISYLMSRPVVLGFTSAAAIVIIATQIPYALGSAPEEESNVIADAVWVLTETSSWDPYTVLITGATIALVLGGRRLHPLLPGVLVAAGFGIASKMFAGYDGAVVGEVPAGLPSITFALPWARLPDLIVPGVVIAIVGFAEASSISRIFATATRERWDSNREFIGQGVANLASAACGGFPVSGSFSRSAINRLAGATSRWSGVVTGAAVLIFLEALSWTIRGEPIFADLLSNLPRAVLAGVVIAAVLNLVKLGALAKVATASRQQAIVGWSTFVATLVLAPRVDQAMMLGIAASVVVHFWVELSPGLGADSRKDGLHLAPTGVLWFGSAQALVDRLQARLAEEGSVSRVVIHMGGLGYIDLTGALALKELAAQLLMTGVKVELHGTPAHARKLFAGAGLEEYEVPESVAETLPQVPSSLPDWDAER